MRLFCIIFLYIVLAARPVAAQSTYPIRTDLLNVYSGSGNGAELQLQNATRTVVGGVLTNINNKGLTAFQLPVNIYSSDGRIQGSGIERVVSGYADPATLNSLRFDSLLGFTARVYPAGSVSTANMLSFSLNNNGLQFGAAGTNLFQVATDGSVTASAYPNSTGQFLTTNASGKLVLVPSPAPNITASNGLTKTGNDIALGGTLTKQTFINTAGNSLHISDISSINNVARVDIGNGEITLTSQLEGTKRIGTIISRNDGSVYLRSNNNGQPGEDVQVQLNASGMNIFGSVLLQSNNASSGAYSVLVRNTSTTKVETVPGSTFLTAVPNLQAVTNVGFRTTNNLEANGFHMYSGSTFIGALSGSFGWPRFGAAAGLRAELSAGSGANIFTVLTGSGQYRFSSQPPNGAGTMSVMVYDAAALDGTTPNIKIIPGNTFVTLDIRSITGTYTIVDSDVTILNKNNTGVTNTVTLPAPSSYAKRRLTLVETSSNTSNWMTFSIPVRWDNTTTYTTMVGAPFETWRRITIQSDGTEWYIVGL